MRYIHNLSKWPKFVWDHEKISTLLASVRHRQGRLLGTMETLGLSQRAETTLQMLTLDVLKSSEIEGDILDRDQVRSSIARRLGLEIAGLPFVDRHVEGVVEMMLDATQNFDKPLTQERLFGWHAALFPTGYSGMVKISVGRWRDDSDGRMQVVSGAYGRERIHFEAPEASRLELEMASFIEWFNRQDTLDPVLKAAIAHLWFVTIHPFDDGNGRSARALADLYLARADGTAQRFYSMSAQIRLERSDYYQALENTQKNYELDITFWLEWFLGCLGRAISHADEIVADVLKKTRFWDKYAYVNFNARQRLVLSKLLDKFEGKLTSSKWAKLAKCSQDTALRDILELVEKNVLIKDSSGGRSTSYELVAWLHHP
jgi:Fic family protein